MYSPKRRMKLFRDSAWTGSTITDTTVYTYTWVQQTLAPDQRYFMLNTDNTGTNVASSTALAGQGPYISTDGGATWNERKSGMTIGSAYTTDVCFARASPTTVYASLRTGYLYKSTNGGTSWSELTSAGSRAWSSIRCSSTGIYVIATVDAGSIYRSADGGSTWTALTAAGTRRWDQGNISENGQVLSVSTFNELVYVSTDGGATWTPNTSFGIQNWRGLSASADGSVIFGARVGSSRPALSTNTGATWTSLSSVGVAGDWLNTATSINGNKLVTAVYNDAALLPGYIYVSQDKGATWTQVNSAGQAEWESVAISPDGKKIIAAVSTGGGVGTVWVGTGA